MLPQPRQRTRVLSLLLAVCCVAATLAAPPPPAAAQAPRTPSKISFAPASPTVEPGKTTIVTATVTDRRNVVIPNARVRWSVPPEQEGLVLLSPSASTRQVIIAGLNPPAGSTPPAAIRLTARSGENAEDDVLLEYKVTTPATPATITTDVTEIELSPGARKEVSAEARVGNTVVKPTELTWDIDTKYRDFVDIGQAVEDGTKTKSVLPVFALFGDPKKTPPSSVPIVVKGAGGMAVVLVRYKTAATTRHEIRPVAPRAGESLSISPGQTEELQVEVLDENKQIMQGAKVEWEALGEGGKFVTLRPDPQTPGKVTVTGLFGPDGARKPFNIPIVARVGPASHIIDLGYEAMIEPQVDVTWDVLPQEIVGDNYGRSVKKEFYCVEVAVGNNSGDDLQLAGLGFELPEVVRSSDGKALRDGDGLTRFAPVRNDAGAALTNSDGTARRLTAGVVPVSSYATVRGSLAKRKLTHPRTMVLAGLNAFGQLLGGFSPFFINPNHSKNFVNGVNIVSNPLAKGVDQVWPDSYGGELERLDQHALRDDKIIPNNTTFKTRVFFPKDALFQHNEPGRDDVREVRRRLGELILVGRIIERKGFINRLRFGRGTATP